MSGELKVGRLRDGIAFRVDGRGTFAQSRVLDQLARAFGDQCPAARIVIDLSRCEYLDSTFLGCLVTYSRKSEQREVSILVSPSCQQKLFGSNHLDRFLPLESGSVDPIDGWEAVASGGTDSRQLGQHVLESHRCLGALDIPNAAAFRSVADRLAAELNAESSDGS